MGNLLIHKWPLPKPRPSAELVYQLAMKDSKRGIACEESHQVSDVLLKKMGEFVPTPTSNLYAFDSALILEWLRAMFPTANERFTDAPAPEPATTAARVPLP